MYTYELMCGLRTVVTTFAGHPAAVSFSDATGVQARFNGPSGVAVDANDNVFVADFGNCRVRKITQVGGRKFHSRTCLVCVFLFRMTVYVLIDPFICLRRALKCDGWDILRLTPFNFVLRV